MVLFVIFVGFSTGVGAGRGIRLWLCWLWCGGGGGGGSSWLSAGVEGLGMSCWKPCASEYWCGRGFEGMRALFGCGVEVGKGKDDGQVLPS